MDAIASATRRIDSPLHAVSTPPIDAARTLSVTADYRLSEAGRKASLLAGGDGRVEQRVKIVVPRLACILCMLMGMAWHD
jgi:hypothetical protein